MLLLRLAARRDVQEQSLGAGKGCAPGGLGRASGVEVQGFRPTCVPPVVLGIGPFVYLVAETDEGRRLETS